MIYFVLRSTEKNMAVVAWEMETSPLYQKRSELIYIKIDDPMILI